MRRSTALFTLALLLVVSSAGATDTVSIPELMAAPGKYINVPIRTEGQVSEVGPKGDGFTLRDAKSGASIKVRADRTPSVGQRTSVEGFLSREAGAAAYFLREFEAAPGLDWRYPGTIIVAVFALAGGGIAFFMRRRRQSVVRTVTTPISVGSTVRLPVVPAALDVLSGARTGQRVVLKYDTTVGRTAGDLALEDATVSTEHARIRFENQRYLLVNRSLTNPTRVNGHPVEGNVDLHDGDELLMGAVKLRFVLMK